MQSKRIILIGGGTIYPVRNHLALCASAYGGTVRALHQLFTKELSANNLENQYTVESVFTKMADHHSSLVTNYDVEKYLDTLIADKSVRVIVFNVALCDFNGTIDGIPSGLHAERLKTKNGEQVMTLTPTDKLIGRIRKERKDIFLVGFKTTTNADSNSQYKVALELLKNNSANLVLANDTVLRNNMIVAPEETRYCETMNREEVLAFLAKMTVSRMQNTFTRSTVIAGDSVEWESDSVPVSLRTVVDHCISNGAYKPVLGKTAGHFAVKINDTKVLTSIRKTNFNDLRKNGLVEIESSGDNQVISRGFKPSVGGQSQRIIFKEHQDLDCIVHFHCPVKPDAIDMIPIREQWPNECGSHECGKNTSAGLCEIDLGDGDKLSVVFLNDHGPNIVFNRSVPPNKVISFIDRNFDLQSKTGGLVYHG